MKALKYPVSHTSQSGCVVTEPTVFVYLPGGHLVWVMHESCSVLVLDMNALNDPVGQTSHSGWEVGVAGIFVYLPGGHLVWARHHSKGQTVGKATHQKVFQWLPNYAVAYEK